ncbi:radical SAM protein [Enterorhabdus sp. P55]|uniref:radical SAM protein n=1 Tax=Enterorhabdus sp. P55 TaxID=2304571 RepID=UPI00351B95E4
MNASVASCSSSPAPDPAALATRPTLAAWLEEYAAIEREWMEGLATYGIDFAPRDEDAAAVAVLRERLRAKGARFRNGGASVSVGRISSACLACTGDRGSRSFFLSLQCNRSCYFCFNVNQEDYEQNRRLKPGWRDEVDAYLAAPDAPTHAALTGGEPLLHKPEAEEFFRRIHDAAPDVHLRLYTAGDFLDESAARALRDAGLQEMRLSVKLGDGPESDRVAIEQALATLALAREVIPDVMVEMPVIPGTEDALRALLRGMDSLGLFGINLLEFCYPYGDWEEYRRRGFKVKNPAFAVLYDYGYAGGLPIAGSERACLELVEWALDEGLSLGVHYCSLDNKNRDQILQASLAAAPSVDEELCQLDDGDFFYRALKVFDGDAPVARERLREAGVPFAENDEDGSLAVHPAHRALLDGLAVARSVNVAQPDGPAGTWRLRELKLEYPA